MKLKSFRSCSKYKNPKKSIILIFLVQLTVYRQEKSKKIEKNEVEKF